MCAVALPMKFRFYSFLLLAVIASTCIRIQLYASENKPVAEDASEPATIQPAELADILRRSGPKPLTLHVGFHLIFHNAHIPGSEFIGPASETGGMEKLRKRVEQLPRKQAIVLYCGCCPWEHCPNVHPAYAELRRMGFTNVRVLYLPQNFSDDWASKGYPVEKGD